MRTMRLIIGTDFGNYESTDNPIYMETWDGDHYLTAYFRYDPPPQGQQRLTISATGGGTTDPSPGEHWYDYGTGVQVNAVGSGFSYWLLDGEYVYTGGSISVTMNQYHTLEAHFNEALPTCALTVYAYEYISHQQVPTNVYVDYQWAGVADTTIAVPLGTRTISVDDYVYVPNLGSYVSIWYNDYGYGSEAEMELWSLHGSITFVYIWQ